MHLFLGGLGMQGVPFLWATSKDNWASWDDLKAVAPGVDPGGYTAQPINTAFRLSDGAMYLSMDAIGASSMLWESRDDGRTWQDTGGRTAGRHTVFVPLGDGSILGLGGKNSNIDGYSPQVISRDRGRTWEAKSRTPFPALASNQRPSLVRLESGRLFLAADYQDWNGKQPPAVRERGSFVALSEDDGRTWRMKKLPGTLPHEARQAPDKPGTIGYSVARQAPDGVIHLITTMNHPSLHFEMNEAWILDAATGMPPESAPRAAGPRMRRRENWPDGRTRAITGGRIGADGRFLLDGEQEFCTPAGRRQYRVAYRMGRKAGMETFYGDHGRVLWQREHRPDGASVLTRFWPGGSRRSVSHWRGVRAEGVAIEWDPDGRETARGEFSSGELTGAKGWAKE